jgi:anti-sigma regulatory factor (Ser/Thr protein kinase)
LGEVSIMHPARTLVLAADAGSVRRARAFVATVLAEWGLAAMAETAMLPTSELVTNAVLHAGSGIGVAVERDDRRSVVRIAVTDGSRRLPRERTGRPMASRGRGLTIVTATCDSFGVQRSSSGKTVWFELGMSA